LTPHPFQSGAFSGLANSPGVARHIAWGDGVISSGAENVLPVTNSASARRSTPVRPLAIESIGPLSIAVSTRSGVIA
jgi:hypothetical protein